LSDAEFIQFSLFEKINAFQSRETEQKGLIAKLSPAYLHGGADVADSVMDGLALEICSDTAGSPERGSA
jgi:hypothetical protein